MLNDTEIRILSAARDAKPPGSYTTADGTSEDDVARSLRDRDYLQETGEAWHGTFWTITANGIIALGR